jgi:peptidoglycan/xylan/chitin deacetylase (PgdA/CDA1 family)
VAGHPTTLLRPPYGAQNPATRSAASACGLDAVVMWSASMDKGELHAVDGRLHPGDIVLLHFDEHLYGDLVQLLDLAAQSGLSVGRLEDHVGANQALPTY